MFSISHRCQAEEHPKARFSRSTLNATLTGSKVDEDLSSSDYILEFDEKGVIAASGEPLQMVLKQQPQTLQRYNKCKYKIFFLHFCKEKTWLIGQSPKISSQ